MAETEDERCGINYLVLGPCDAVDPVTRLSGSSKCALRYPHIDRRNMLRVLISTDNHLVSFRKGQWRCGRLCLARHAGGVLLVQAELLTLVV